MAKDVIIKKRFLGAAKVDGYKDGDTVRTRLFRKTATVDGTVNAGDTFTSSEYIAAVELPKGFIPSCLACKVYGANAAESDLTVSIAKNADIASESSNNFDHATLVAFSGDTIELDKTGLYYAELVATGAVASTTATLTSKRFIAGKSANPDYLVFKASADVDAEFEVMVFGDWASFGG